MLPRIRTGFLIVLLGGIGQAAGEDHFVCIGGGASPQSNQVSLEKNVVFFARSLDRAGADATRRHVLFADGKLPRRDVQYRDDDAKVNKAETWMTRLLGDETMARIRYRDNRLGDPDVPVEVAGPARKAYLSQHLDELSEKLTAGDRLILYVTTHGGPSMADRYDYVYDEEYGEMVPDDDDGNDFDTTISLWNEESVSMTEWVDKLNQFAADVPIVMIMTQCHSGGFAETIFQNGDRRLGLNPRPRCGFFSTLHDRVATGCTPEIDETTYRDYSTYFWEALGGRSRRGNSVAGVDCDGNGQISFAEAHAHALIRGDSIDVPLCTSDVLLRRYSEISDAPPPTETESSPGFFGSLFGGREKPEEEVDQAARILGREQTIGDLLDVAAPPRRRVIQSLYRALEFTRDSAVDDVEKQSRKWSSDSEDADADVAPAMVARETARSDIMAAVARQWPELAGESYHPIVTKLTGRDADEFVSFIQSLPQTEAYENARQEYDRLSETAESAGRRDAKTLRLLRTLQSVLLRVNLPLVASQHRQTQVRQLIDLENQTLSP